MTVAQQAPSQWSQKVKGHMSSVQVETPVRNYMTIHTDKRRFPDSFCKGNFPEMNFGKTFVEIKP
jgi:hypothetical protein